MNFSYIQEYLFALLKVDVRLKRDQEALKNYLTII